MNRSAFRLRSTPGSISHVRTETADTWTCFLVRNVKDPRALAEIFAKAEAQLADKLHPDPYIRAFLHAITYTSRAHDLLSNSRDDGWWHKMVSLFDCLAIKPKYIDIRFVHRERNLPVRLSRSLSDCCAHFFRPSHQPVPSSTTKPKRTTSVYVALGSYIIAFSLAFNAISFCPRTTEHGAMHPAGYKVQQHSQST